MFSRKLTRPIAIGTTAIVVALGAYGVVNWGINNGSTGTANAATPAQPAQSRPQLGNNQTVVGQIPQNWHSGSGTIITGAAADKAEAAAVAKYPGGTVNRVLLLSDGSYAVHQIKISWPHHVFVNKSFEVTGAIG